MTNKPQVSECPGCHVKLSVTDYPADNRYGILSPECRQIFDEIIVKERERYGYPPAHRLIVDAYGVQHPPHIELQKELNISTRFIAASVQSIAIHLIALYLAFEKNIPLQDIAGHMDRVLTYMRRHNITFEELAPPSDLGSMRATDIHNATIENITLEEYSLLARQWAESAWHAWKQHHDKVRFWYAEYSQ